VTPLDRLIRRMIAQDGPMPVAQFMALALQHPEHGYYRQAAPIGRAGDFITAPEISQVFGELLGLWTASVWDQAGRPSPALFCEAGPGRGVLMADALRASNSLVPDFSRAAQVHLIESNSTLREIQAAALADAAPVWCENAGDLPDGPLFLVANEFLDALPVQQWVMTADGWRERVVGIDAKEALAFAASDDPAADLVAAGLSLPSDAGVGAVHEMQPAALKLAGELAGRFCQDQPGVALFIDYGRTGQAGRSTFRGIRDHAFVDPLVDAGAIDLTADVDFSALKRAAEAGGAAVYGPVGQGAFLQALGIEARRAALRQQATEDQRQIIDAAIDRLVDPAAMGAIFKVMAIASPTLGPLPGFPA